MNYLETDLSGVMIIEPEIIGDGRGFFTRTFCQKENKENGIKFDIKQTNRSFSKKEGTIRGLHIQKFPKSEPKIVSCIHGAIFDVVVDVREGSSTFGNWIGIDLNDENLRMLYIPAGFAHGFQTLSDNVELLYYMGEYYSSEHATGYYFNDPVFNINWPLSVSVISEKDKSWKKI